MFLKKKRSKLILVDPSKRSKKEITKTHFGTSQNRIEDKKSGTDGVIF